MTSKRLIIIFTLLLSLSVTSQEAPIHNEYVSPETEQAEDPKKSYLIGAGAFVVILVAVGVRRRIKKRKAGQKKLD